MTGTSYRWVIVAAGGFLGCVAMGAMFCLPVILLPMARATGWSMTGVWLRHDRGLPGHGRGQHGLGQPLETASGRALWC